MEMEGRARKHPGSSTSSAVNRLKLDIEAIIR